MTQDKKNNIEPKAAKDMTYAELLRYSGEHLLYEIAMLFSTAEVLSGWPAALSEKLRMAALESFAVHARNVISFFYAAPKGREFDTDIMAKYFYPDDKLPADFPKIEKLEAVRERANKQVEHLTTERIYGTPPEKGWAFNEIANELRERLIRFVDSAEKSKLHEDVRRYVHEPLPLRIRVGTSSTSTSSVSHVITFKGSP